MKWDRFQHSMPLGRDCSVQSCTKSNVITYDLEESYVTKFIKDTAVLHLSAVSDLNNITQSDLERHEKNNEKGDFRTRSVRDTINYILKSKSWGFHLLCCSPEMRPGL